MDCSTILNAVLRNNALQGFKQGGPLDPPELMGRAITLIETESLQGFSIGAAKLDPTEICESLCAAPLEGLLGNA